MNLLLTGAFNYTEEQIEKLSNLGFQIYYIQNESEELPIQPEEIDAVVCNGLFLYHDIKKFVRLKYIQLTSAGFDRVPIDYIRKQGIKIFNAKGVYSIPMAEWVLFRALECYKNADFFKEKQKKHLWEKDRHLKELFGKRVAIVGAGNIGQEVGKRFQAFGCKTFGFDVHSFEADGLDCVCLISELDAYLPDFDIIVLTLPLTDETYHLFNYARFELMKEGSLLMNISRGSVINESDLVRFLSEKQRITAILDVFEEEPLPVSSKLWEFDNVLLSPHNSFVGEGNASRLFDVILNNFVSNL